MNALLIGRQTELDGVLERALLGRGHPLSREPALESALNRLREGYFPLLLLGGDEGAASVRALRSAPGGGAPYLLGLVPTNRSQEGPEIIESGADGVLLHPWPEGLLEAHLVAAERRMTEWAWLEALKESHERMASDFWKARRAHRTLSACNRMVLSAPDEPSLLDGICRVVVEQGGYRMAWVGYAQSDAEQSIRPMAAAGVGQAYLDGLRISWGADSPRGGGPGGRALREGRPMVSRNILTDPTFAPWRAEAVAQGYASAVALPVALEGTPGGILALYAPEPDAFGTEELQLLEELAADLAFGVKTQRDRVEHRRIQERLLVADRLSAMGTLAAGVAHEINNPLTYVMANLDFLQEECRRMTGLPETHRTEIHDALQATREGAERLKAIVGDVKSFARPQDPTLEDLDVREVLDGSLRIAFGLLRHRVRLIREYHAVPAVRADAARLGQVFLNLLMNASEAFPEASPDLNWVRVRTDVDGEGKVQVAVSDNGPGIPEVLVDRIFEPFFTTKPAGVGTGLGLAISNGIVRSIGGAIEVESRPGRGTTFRILLPAVPAAQPAAPAPRRGRVLVVEDDPWVASGLRRTLQGEHDVIVVSEGREALEHLAAPDPFDLILSDLHMPGMSGMELHAELMRRDPKLAARLVFLTGTAGGPGAEFLAGVPNRTLAKPYDPEALRALVRSQIP